MILQCAGATAFTAVFALGCAFDYNVKLSCEHARERQEDSTDDESVHTEYSSAEEQQ